MTDQQKALIAIGMATVWVEFNCTTGMVDSAKLCLADAKACYRNNQYKYAYNRALQSLSYSVTIASEHYKYVAGL